MADGAVRACASFGLHAVIDTAIDWEILPCLSGSLATPHAWLGLDADVREPAAIVQAARDRLEAIRDAYGSEREVRDVLISIIVTARQELLALAREEGCFRHPR